MKTLNVNGWCVFLLLLLAGGLTTANAQLGTM